MSAAPFVLTGQRAAQAALTAFDMGLLGFDREVQDGSCRYDYGDGHRCALGAGLPAETLAALDLYGFGETDFKDGDTESPMSAILTYRRRDYGALRMIQDGHDDICRLGPANPHRTRAIASYRAMLARLAAEPDPEGV